ncbi:MAG: hypothetical protein ACK4UJ_02930 [Leptonema sp. (in: bacteria)]
MQRYEFCDDYDYKFGSCNINPDTIDFNKKFTKKTILKEIGYDLYFQKKITYGVRITAPNENWDRWNCFFLFIDKKQQFKESSLKMEGKRTINSSFWCFDYLGSLYLEFLKKNHIEEEKINQNSFTYILKILVYKDNHLKKILQREGEFQNLY